MRDPKIIEIWTLCVPLAKIFSCYYAKHLYCVNTIYTQSSNSRSSMYVIYVHEYNLHLQIICKSIYAKTVNAHFTLFNGDYALNLV